MSFTISFIITFLSCFDKGPGISIDYIVDTISFLVAIALVWIAFIALYWSKPKGKAKFRYEQLGNTPEFETNLKSKCCCCSFSSSQFFFNLFYFK